MNDLASWANSSGIIVKDIEVRADPSKGRGLYATSAQWQLRVPASAFISNESIRLEINNHPILSSVTSAANNIVIYLAYHLVHSEGHGLQPYLNSLPRQSDSPTLWSREERELLTGSSLWFPLQAKLRSLHAVFEDLPAPVKSAFTFQDFQFADALFRSRSLDVPGTPGGVLVPFVDFVNHSEYPNCEWHAGEDGVSLVQTEPVDGELLISYGDKSAAEMLYSYGFIPSEYKHATQITAPLEMDREVLAQDAVIELKLAAFGKVPTITFDSQGWTSNFIWYSYICDVLIKGWRLCRLKTGWNARMRADITNWLSMEANLTAIEIFRGY